MQKLVDIVCSGSGMNMFAFAGALWAAKDAGYEPRRLAGVSGGALVQTAVAAGYEPGAELNQVLLGLCPVAQFADPEIAWPWGSRVRKASAFADKTPWWWPFKSHGALKGAKLEAVVADRLKAKGVATFSDLKKDLYILTTTTGPNGPADAYEWSKAKTPNASVALAAVASARIPFLFQRKELDGKHHIDGGVWSNFPVDFFADEGKDTLGFYFGHAGAEASAEDLLGEAGMIVNVMMQSRMLEDIKDAPKATIIVLPEGNALDFWMTRTAAEALLKRAYEATLLAFAQLPPEPVPAVVVTGADPTGVRVPTVTAAVTLPPTTEVISAAVEAIPPP